MEFGSKIHSPYNHLLTFGGFVKESSPACKGYARHLAAEILALGKLMKSKTIMVW